MIYKKIPQTYRCGRRAAKVRDVVPGGDEDPGGGEAGESHKGPSHVVCRPLQDRTVRCLSVVNATRVPCCINICPESCDKSTILTQGEGVRRKLGHFSKKGNQPICVNLKRVYELHKLPICHFFVQLQQIKEEKNQNFPIVDA